MTPQPECCTPDDSVIEVARVMEMRDVGVVPVVESQDTRRLVGVITDRDIVLRIVAQGHDPNDIVSVRDVMTTDLVTCSPDADVFHVEELMKERKVRRVLVVDEHGACVGVVAMSDLTRKADEAQVGDTEKAITTP